MSKDAASGQPDDPYRIDPDLLARWCARLDGFDDDQERERWIAATFQDHPRLGHLFGLYIGMSRPPVDPGPATPAQRSESIQARFTPGSLVLGRFRVRETIGSGGSGGAVFLAEDVVEESPAAIKVLQPVQNEQRRQAYQEAVLLRRLAVPGVVGYLTEGEVDGHVIIVMQYVPGVGFGIPAASHPPPTIEHILRALLETLGRIHASGFLHNDLKPPNVIVAAADGLPVVLDLGVSSALDVGAPHGVRHGGTPAYMAPERLEGRAASVQSDLFACALMAWEALQGRPLGYATTDARDAVIRARISWCDEDLTQALEVLPDHLHPFFQSCLAPDPADRPRTTREALALLTGDAAPDLHALLSELPPDRPLDLEQLRGLFVGIEAGLEMRLRGGLLVRAACDSQSLPPTPRHVQDLLDGWERARRGYWDIDGFHLDLGTLRGLEFEFPSPSRSVQGPVVLEPDDPRNAWLDLLQIARGRVSDPLLARVLGEDPDHFSTEVERLDLRGEAERIRAIAADQRIELTRAIADALPSASPLRLDFLLEAQVHDRLADTLDACLDELLDRGWVGDAARLTAEVLWRLPARAHTPRLLAIALLVGCRARDQRLIRDVRERIEHALLRRDQRDELRRLAQAAGRTRYAEARTHYAELSDGPASTDTPRLREAFACVRASLLCRMPVEDARPHLAPHRRTPAESLDPVRALVLAIHCAQEGAVDEAAERFQELARRTLPRDIALAVGIEGARNEFQRMATGRIETYIQMLRREVRDRRGDWLRLHVLYLARRLAMVTDRDSLPPEPEHPMAASLVGDHALAVDFALLEAGAAWRQGDADTARAVVEATRVVAPSAAEVAGVALLRAFATFLDNGNTQPAKSAFNQLMERGAYPSIQLQSAAFLVKAGANISGDYRALLALALQRIPVAQRGYHRDLLTLEQARAWLEL